MEKIIGIALVVFGVVLLGYGMSAADSFSSEVSRFFTGKPTDKSIWMILGGAVSIVVGAGTMFFNRQRPAGGGIS